MARYTNNEIEFIKVKLETIQNDYEIARQFIKHFDSPRKVDAVRVRVRDIRHDKKLGQRNKQIKRLFFDIETSQVYFKGWRTGKQWVGADQITKDKKIICISYKWQFENEVHTLTWDENHNDKKLLKKFIKILGECDEAIAHNGDRFDIKELRTRAILSGLLMFPNYRTFDTLKKARKYFNFHSNKLDYIGKVLNVGRKLDHEGRELWDKVEAGNKKALKKMVDYCEQDVLLLEDVFHALSPYVDHNTNYAVLLGGEKWQCPNCASKSVKMHRTETTAMGWIRRYMKCKSCKKDYKISNKSYIKYLTDGNN